MRSTRKNTVYLTPENLRALHETWRARRHAGTALIEVSSTECFVVIPAVRGRSAPPLSPPANAVIERQTRSLFSPTIS